VTLVSSGGIAAALTAAFLFGVSTPAAKLVLVVTDPWLTAGLLYLGCGVGLGGYRLLQRLAGSRSKEAPFCRRDLPWLISAIVSGGIVGPLLLMFGLAQVSASQASLLLNVEGVLTAVLARLAFGEHIPRRIALGMVAITVGALLLAWRPGEVLHLERGALFVIGACLAWAIDNNLTREVSGGDPLVIAGLKGGVAGTVNIVIALVAGAAIPALNVVLGIGLIGLVGYGVSLLLFVRALRQLGTARTGAYFSIAPFVGAATSIVVFREPFTPGLVVGGALMLLGVSLHLTERHEHEHVHEALEHEHLHDHDEHHQHAHDPGAVPGAPHSHLHVHTPLRHWHPHYPDLHHRHGH
jgi:drug/metabolite transporter (DMT)-like permease